MKMNTNTQAGTMSSYGAYGMMMNEVIYISCEDRFRCLSREYLRLGLFDVCIKTLDMNLFESQSTNCIIVAIATCRQINFLLHCASSINSDLFWCSFCSRQLSKILLHFKI